jgi:hypothetical protein
MSDTINKTDAVSGDPGEVLLQQLLHLKKYELPEPSRMVKSKQNIMRQVREVNSQKRWSLGDLLEVNIPWFFAEPRYGIALLFIMFAGLQFWGASSREQAQNTSGIYTSNGNIAAYEQTSAISSNSISYPKLPSENLQLFPDTPKGDSSVRFVGRLEEKK